MSERDEIAAFIAAQQAADPTFDADAVWAEYRYEKKQQLVNDGRGRHVKPREYTDPETGTESTLYEVMAPSPDSVRGAWGDHYRIACYGDEAAAEEHARTGCRPHGYG
jgi:hypothetical protein